MTRRHLPVLLAAAVLVLISLQPGGPASGLNQANDETNSNVASPDVFDNATTGTGTAPGLDDRTTHMTLLTVLEQDCSEIAIRRAVSLSAIEPMIPAGYVVVPINATAISLGINDYTCRNLSVDGQPLEQETVVTLGTVRLASRHGQPIIGNYLVWLGTDNAELAARYRQVGLPARFLPKSTSSIETSPSGGVTMTLTFEGGGLDHYIRADAASVPNPQPPPGPSTFTVYYSGEAGEVRFRAVNTEQAFASAAISGDLSTGESIVPLFFNPVFLKMNNITAFTTPFIRGNWTTTIERLN